MAKRQVLSFHGAEICWSCDWPRYTAKTVLSPQNVHWQLSYTPHVTLEPLFPKSIYIYYYLFILFTYDYTIYNYNNL